MYPEFMAGLLPHSSLDKASDLESPVAFESRYVLILVGIHHMLIGKQQSARDGRE